MHLGRGRPLRRHPFDLPYPSNTLDSPIGQGLTVAHILAYTLATGQYVVRRLSFTAYTSYRRRHREYLLGYIAGFSNRGTS
jgi:hypothetical protein